MSAIMTTTSANDIQALESQHVLQTYRRQPVTFVRGEGVRLFDAEGREYLDLLSGIGVAADLHLAVSSPEIVLPGTIPVTSTAEAVVTKVAGHKYLDDLIKTPFRFDNGLLYVPDGPGLGIEVDEAKLAKYRIG